MEAREAELLPVPYFHVVFTLPSTIAAVAFQNKAKVYGLLFQTAGETLTTIAEDAKRLGAEIGLTAVLHTWGQNLDYHPHVHCIVPGGGLSADRARWVHCRPGFFLPVRVLSRMFRRLFLDGLASAFDAANCSSSAISPRSRSVKRSSPISPLAARANGLSTPSDPSPAPRRFWPVSGARILPTCDI